MALQAGGQPGSIRRQYQVPSAVDGEGRPHQVERRPIERRRKAVKERVDRRVAGVGIPDDGPVLREHPERGVRARPQPGLRARRADVDEIDLSAVGGEIERSRLTLQRGHALVVFGPGRSGRPGRERDVPLMDFPVRPEITLDGFTRALRQLAEKGTKVTPYQERKTFARWRVSKWPRRRAG